MQQRNRYINRTAKSPDAERTQFMCSRNDFIIFSFFLWNRLRFLSSQRSTFIQIICFNLSKSLYRAIVWWNKSCSVDLISVLSRIRVQPLSHNSQITRITGILNGFPHFSEKVSFDVRSMYRLSNNIISHSHQRCLQCKSHFDRKMYRVELSEAFYESQLSSQPNYRWLIKRFTGSTFVSTGAI